MTLTDDAKSVLLLCSRLRQKSEDGIRPFTVGEYSKFAQWLHSVGHRPASLLREGSENIFAEMPDHLPNRDRTVKLIDRGVALGAAYEHWTSQGLWVICRSDDSYPKQLKTRLNHAAPPVLYGIGSKSLFIGEGLAVIGSRNATDAELDSTARISHLAAKLGIQIVSGGARGVDSIATEAALENRGRSVAVLADGLGKAAISVKYRDYLRSGQLLLVSPFEPESRFMVGNAMARNKYIYSLSNWAVVVCCTAKKGGTWAGAIENLKKKWIPLFALRGEKASKDNLELIAEGAFPMEEESLFSENFRDILNAHLSGGLFESNGSNIINELSLFR